MKILLWINTIVEGLAGLLFLFYPNMGQIIPLLNVESLAVSMMIKMYGVAASSLALLSAWLLYRLGDYERVLAAGLLLFTLFHFGIAMTQFVYNPMLSAGILHLGLAAAFGYFWWKRV